MRRLGLVVALLCLALLAGMAIGVRGYMAEPLAIRGEAYTLEVSSGSSLRAVADELSDAGILRYPGLLAIVGRVTGAAVRIKAGEYEIRAGATPQRLLDQLVEGRVKLHAFTIIEGWTVADLRRTLASHGAVRSTLGEITDAELAAMLDLPQPSAEGWFFPDTYHFARGTTDRDILERAHALMLQRLGEAWEGRASPLPLDSAYDALILASIVERETALDRERPLVAGVFTRRLQRGMRLQTDPAVIYGLGADFDGDLRRRDLERDGPYNTYTRSGLPPTPIALPGQSSLLAVVHPAAGEALYFVASEKLDGSHTFTATLEEHNRAVTRYLKALRMQKK